MDGHLLSVFKNRSVTAPRSPRTKNPSDKSNLSFCSPEVPSNMSSGEAIKYSDVEQLLQSNIELRKEVQQCREEYQSTLATMQTLRATHTDLCSSICDSKVTQPPLAGEGICDTRMPLYCSDSQEVENGTCGKLATTEQRPYSDTTSSAVLCEEGAPSDTKDHDPFSSPGMDLIERMWENFSVDSYSAELPLERWRPSVTIPQPFSMTLREIQEPRKKSRSMLIAEKERTEMAAQMDAEMKKQFRATPVPASTFLPLYTLIRAKDARHLESLKIKQRSVGDLTERDRRRPYSADCTERLMFKAKPIPKDILSCEVTERINCEEEYRKVRIKVRAQSLVASSRLPFTTHSRTRQQSAPSQANLRQEKVDTRHAEGTRVNHAPRSRMVVCTQTVTTSRRDGEKLKHKSHRNTQYKHSEVRNTCIQGVEAEGSSSPYPAPTTRSINIQKDAARKKLRYARNSKEQGYSSK